MKLDKFYFFLSFLLVIGLTASDCLGQKYLNHSDDLAGKRLRSELVKAKQYAKNQAGEACRMDLVFMVDFSLPSEQYRFFVCELATGRLLDQGLVAHGSGSAERAMGGQLHFSNIPNSYCSSLGPYRIGQAYVGQFGPSYRLHGLASSNSEAYRRAIVLHAHDCVPEEADGQTLCESLGCPTVSHGFFKRLQAHINRVKGQGWVLLWIYA